MFGEPLSYLDVNQRLKAAQFIQSLLRPTGYTPILTWFMNCDVNIYNTNRIIRDTSIQVDKGHVLGVGGDL